MTANVITLLEQIKELDIFKSHQLYFVGGTALAYYLGHRISEDIDIIGTAPLPHRQITNEIMALGGTKLKDANAIALRLAGLFPDERMLKFSLNNIKLEFFAASTPLQKEIIKTASSQPYKNGKLQIIDLQSIAKLKLIALLNRKKSRDLFDFKIMLEKNTLTKEQILEIGSKAVTKIDSFLAFYDFIENMQVAEDDEIVYLDEKDPKPLNWNEIHNEVLSLLSLRM
ncbi:MAG: nucleotidyl transferase AbiEii/AbiGii toxin family protein [Hydrogenimonas sp.]|nr:nucleotidyl transferase AbiEii/AbiGii toxin family protein [Hydrogenimonas sp.]